MKKYAIMLYIISFCLVSTGIVLSLCLQGQATEKLTSEQAILRLANNPITIMGEIENVLRALPLLMILFGVALAGFTTKTALAETAPKTGKAVMIVLVGSIVIYLLCVF